MAVATGADHVDVRHIEAEQGRQGAEGLGQADEGVGAENGGLPDETVTPGGEQNQQHHQRCAQGHQPQAVNQQPEQPAIELLALQQHQQGGG
ncbi:hypothetical protein D3C80_1786830 [compost metagenome]